MSFLYVVVLIIGLVIWFVASIVALMDEVDSGENLKLWAAISTSLFFGIIIWPVTLAVVLVSFLCYGLYSAVDLTRNYLKERKV